MPSIITVIPARGGSKSIPKKNIIPLGGKPLLAYTIEAALQAHLNGPLIVSTDDEEISKVALKFGSEVVKRPPEISGDTASTESALLHVLDVLEDQGKKFDMILTLPPTSPFRKSETIRAFVKRFLEVSETCDAMLSLHEDRTDFWIQKNSMFERLFPHAPRRRQERDPLYAENSALYITKTSSLRETESILGKNAIGFVISQEEALDINEPRDILLAEFFLCHQK